MRLPIYFSVPCDVIADAACPNRDPITTEMEERIKVLLHKDLLRSLGTCSFYYTVMLACGCRKNGCLESPSLVFLDGHKQLKRILLLARLPGKSFNACRPHILFPVPDPDLEIRGVGGGGLVI